ncbi:RNA polymerase II elongation factor Ell [Linepithema humile]|uniref:RNA polymerase II elongation factor Ell n=1 Tax=Linepithema humile TaxID=83485 RepID=UPI0006239389|nr:PREDICTED: RNA polymerase II elongation factor Ell [Linepithema humile]
MGDGEMALVPGVQYGLSSHSYLGEHKAMIFTKLTDSASRSIHEYIKIRHKLNQGPTIQFLGNEGQLNIPSSHGLAEFNFSLFSNQDIEGPQNGFECVQQVAHKNLNNLGNLSYKMRIQANDDVYETTRHRMAVAEENNKNKCTRVIKANGPDIGRKVKVKGTGRIIPPPYAKHRESTTTIPTSGSSQSKASTNKPAASNSSSNHPATTRSPEKKISDLMRRPLKERLIHLLALRPYKKPEIYDRITREGIRDRERSIIMTVLKQVATVRDNTYELQRHIWNDVQEDWPFYTDQEKAILKRRKPQNLTPPASDGGSSGSGHSPNSIHAGSPPAITAPPASLQGNKRPGYYQGNDGLPTKKPRISHYRRPEPISFISSSSAPERASSGSSYNNNNSSGVSATAIGGDRTAGSNSACGANSNSAGNRSDGFVEAWESRQQTQRERNSRVDYRAERIANSDVLRDTGNSYGAVASAVAAISDGSSNRPSCLTSSPSDSARSNHHQMAGHGRDSGTTTVSSGNAAEGSSNEVNIDRRDKSDRSRGAREERNRERESRNRSTAATLGTNFHNEASSSGAPTYNANSTNNANAAVAAVAAAAAAAAGSLFERPANLREYPDYLTDYVTVSSVEQKRRYKEDFCANYDEYRKLHAKMVVVGQHFTNLYNSMQGQKDLGNTARAQVYKEQILRDYNACKNDPRHLQMKTRFDYLHDKLSHIKRLILEYETAMSNNRVVNATSNTNTRNIGDVNSRHY